MVRKGKEGGKMQEIKKQIRDWLSENKEEMYTHLKKLMEFESVTEDRECCKEALHYVADLAESFGMKVTVGKYEDVAVIEIGEGDTALGILAHIDVVDAGNLENWICPPYTLTQKDGILYGRGIVDDKGAVISSLYAMKFLKETVQNFTQRIQLIVGSSEEEVWTDMQHYKEEFELPDYGYSPDGNFPIFNAENGYMDVEIAFKQEIPTEYSGFKSGVATNSVPSEAVYEYNGKQHRVTGIGAHSSTPELGENAMVKLAETLKDSGLDFAEFLCNYFPEGEYASLLNPKKVEIQVPEQFRLATTIVPTVLTQTGRNVCINFNIRQAFDIPNENIIEAFEAHKDEYNYEIRIAESLSPIFVDNNQAWLERMKEIYESYGKKNDFFSAAGCSYAKAVPNFVSWGPVFHEDLDCAHMENEQISDDSFMLGAEIYAAYLYGEGTK